MTLAHRLAAVAAAALLAVPAAAEAQARRSPPPASGAARGPAARQLSLGGILGFDLVEGETGFGLRGDLVMPLQRLQQNASLEGVGSLGFTRFSEDESIFGTEIETSTNLVKAVPAARFRLDLAPQLGVYGDVGLGLYFFTASIDSNVPAFEDDDSGLGITMRFAVGGLYQINPQVSLVGEFGANPYFGDVDTTTWNLMFGALLRL